MRRKLAEEIILRAVREQLCRTEQFRYLLGRMEEEVAQLSAHLSETIRVEETKLGAEERRFGNFLDFIGEGRGSRALAQALLETERRVEALREELEGLRRSRRKVCQVPPPERVEERLERMQEVLERRTERSALERRPAQVCIVLLDFPASVGRPHLHRPGIQARPVRTKVS